MNVVIRTLSICTGYGGIELGLSAVGDFEPVCYVENEITAATILAKRMEEGSFPKAPIWSDLRTFDGRPWRGRVDLLTGGFPCQPFSVAGVRRGVDDPRNMYPEVERLAGELGYPTLFLENVPGILQYYYETIRPGLQGMGYTVTEGLFTAAETGAPHKRQRLFILAYSEGERHGRGHTIQRGDEERNIQPSQRTGSEVGSEAEGRSSELALTRHPELQGRVEGTEGCEGSTLGEPAPQGSELAHPSGLGRARQIEDGELGREERPTLSDQGLVNTHGTGPQGYEHGLPHIPTEAGDQLAYPKSVDEVTSGPIGGRAGQPKEETGSDGSHLADPERIGTQVLVEGEGGQSGQSRLGSEELAHTGSEGLQGDGPTGMHGSAQAPFTLPLYPPGPDDYEGWTHLLDVLPQVEPTFCRDAYGPTPGVDGRLRATGNGVVPAVAAFAWRYLTKEVKK